MEDLVNLRSFFWGNPLASDRPTRPRLRQRPRAAENSRAAGGGGAGSGGAEGGSGAFGSGARGATRGGPAQKPGSAWRLTS